MADDNSPRSESQIETDADNYSDQDLEQDELESMRQQVLRLSQESQKYDGLQYQVECLEEHFRREIIEKVINSR